jgi:ABC-type branched-subunit amino acid transport system ATPase component
MTVKENLEAARAPEARKGVERWRVFELFPDSGATGSWRGFLGR